MLGGLILGFVGGIILMIFLNPCLISKPPVCKEPDLDVGPKIIKDEGEQNNG
jgi:hypothetical protein